MRFIAVLSFIIFLAVSMDAEARGRCASGVRVNSECVATQTLRNLEAKYGSKAQPGNYWYDSRSGLFGHVGQPPMGQIPPGMPFAKTLRRNASNGDTGVVINGRELSKVEVMMLSQLGPVVPGRYWMDAMTNVGFEGNPIPFTNLAALMNNRGQQQRRNGGGGVNNDFYYGRAGDNYYGNSNLGTYANSSGGCSYVMTSAGSVTSGCD